MAQSRGLSRGLSGGTRQWRLDRHTAQRWLGLFRPWAGGLELGGGAVSDFDDQRGLGLRATLGGGGLGQGEDVGLERAEGGLGLRPLGAPDGPAVVAEQGAEAVVERLDAVSGGGGRLRLRHQHGDGLDDAGDLGDAGAGGLGGGGGGGGGGAHGVCVCLGGFGTPWGEG